MELSLSEVETALIERLLREYQTTLASNGMNDERELVALMLYKLSHPMRGVLNQSESALLTDVGASISPW